MAAQDYPPPSCTDDGPAFFVKWYNADTGFHGGCVTAFTQDRAEMLVREWTAQNAMVGGRCIYTTDTIPFDGRCVPKRTTDGAYHATTTVPATLASWASALVPETIKSYLPWRG